MKNNNVRYLTETAIMVAISTVLSLFSLQFPFGGSITLASALPVVVIAYRYGIKKGLLAAFVASALQFVVGYGQGTFSYVPTLTAAVLVFFLDYILAFTVYGFAGLFRNSGKNPDARGQNILNFGAGIFIALTLRFLCHLFSGAVIWYSLTKIWEADNSSNIVFKYGPWVYSFLYNIAYMAPEIILSIVSGIVLISFINIKSDNFLYKKV